MNIFVISEFGDPFDQIYEAIAKKLNDCHNVERADSEHHQLSIIKKIIQDISSSDLVIADLTNGNPNVFYELGIAHSLNKPTIHITQSIKSAPFDLKSYNLIEYSVQFDKFQKFLETINKMVSMHSSGRLKTGNPVADFLGSSARLNSMISVDAESKSPDQCAVSDELDKDGFVDLIEKLELSVEETEKLFTGLAEDMDAFSENVHNSMIIHQLNVAESVAEPRKVIEISKFVASEMDSLTAKVSGKMNELTEFTDLICEFGEILITIFSTLSEPDKGGFLEHLHQYLKLSQIAKRTIDSLDEMRGMLRPLRNLSRDLRRPISRLDSIFLEINGKFETVVAVGERLQLLMQSDNSS